MSSLMTALGIDRLSVDERLQLFREIRDSLETEIGTLSLGEPEGRRMDQQAARGRFERHIGEVDLGKATGADNESIDADLARAYADNHEEG